MPMLAARGDDADHQKAKCGDQQSREKHLHG